MRILVTNDDGIQAEGIQRLASALAKHGEVFVAAPERERSAAGHGITMHKPLRVTQVLMKYHDGMGFAVSGTPADCVKLAVEELMPKPPDIVISGINSGANVGTDILYSGTVSAAIEGAISGYKSMAISLDVERPYPCFLDSSSFAAKIAKVLFENHLPEDTLLNVNIPQVSWEEIKGVMVTRLGTRKYLDSVEKRIDPRGRPYFWLSGTIDDSDCARDTDNSALMNNYISVTPVHFDLTNYTIMNQVKEWQFDK